MVIMLLGSSFTLYQLRGEYRTNGDCSLAADLDLISRSENNWVIIMLFRLSLITDKYFLLHHFDRDIKVLKDLDYSVPHLHLLPLSFATHADALFCIASSHRSLFLRLSDLDPREGAVVHDDKSILIIQIHQQCDGLCTSSSFFFGNLGFK
jgi:hypothetical protein